MFWPHGIGWIGTVECSLDNGLALLPWNTLWIHVVFWVPSPHHALCTFLASEVLLIWEAQ